MLRSIADHILDIAQNSVKAGSKNVKVVIEEGEDEFRFVVEDDGHGMDEEELSRVFDPFFTTRDEKKRRVGLGLPFLKQITELTGGYTKIESRRGEGTRVEALFKLKSVDCPPVGDIAGTVGTLIFGSEKIRWIIERYRKGELLYRLDSEELRRRYGEVFDSPSFMKTLLETLEEMESAGEVGDDGQG